MAELLNNPKMPDGFCVLRCIGYFLDISNSAMGLAYAVPPSVSAGTEPVSLKTLVRKLSKPNLGDLFSLARKLIRCIAEFHKAGWLCKTISSHNVIFFKDELYNEVQGIRVNEELSRPNQMRVQPQETPFVKSSIGQQTLPKHDEIPSESRLSFLSRKIRRRKATPSLAAPSSPSSSSSLTCAPDQAHESRAQAHIPAMVSSPALRPTLHSYTALQNPYLVGFDHSRPDNPHAFTTGPTRDGRPRPYQHPSYRTTESTTSFRAEFDYYSIGLVLLEIGLWTTLEDLVDNKIEAYLAKGTHPWVEDFVPRLGSIMGNVFRDAVKACLNGQLKCSDDNRGGSAALFESLVVTQLEFCRA